MAHQKKIEISLFIMRVACAIFLGLWATLKFYHPEWTRNIINNMYKISSLEVTNTLAYTLGCIQLLIVLLFLLGVYRFWTYGLMMLMSAAGIMGSLGALMQYMNYPKNLMLTSIPTFGALLALFILRDLDNFLSLGKSKTKKE